MKADVGFSGSYSCGDVTFLLRRIELAPTALPERERLIQSGRRHYSEMIGPEDAPTRQRIQLFRECLSSNGQRLASDSLALANALAASAPQRDLTIVSIARAGTPIGVLLLRLLRSHFGWPEDAVRHYSISVIRDRGLDAQALNWIMARHGAETIRFVDGWTGKGTIATELRVSLNSDQRFAGSVDAGLWTPLDISGCAKWSASVDDYLIPCSLLGGTISGLVSRSVLPRADIGSAQFHGCVELTNLRRYDLSRWFVRVMQALCRDAPATRPTSENPQRRYARTQEFIDELMQEFKISDRNRVKVGIGEAVRVALRRLPDRLLLRETASADARMISKLAALRGIPIEHRSQMPVAAVALIAEALASR